jgi:branched-chain amino acid transport system permease protein
MLIFLLYYALRGQAGDALTGGALDRAIAPQGGDPSMVSSTAATPGRARLGFIAAVVVVGFLALLPVLLDVYWAGLVAAGFAVAIALLSYTLVVGEGGMVWLCQITFAGGGAVLAAELVGRWGWPPLAAVIVSALLIVPVGVVIGLLTIRLGNLYVALVTLTFGSLVQTLILTQDPFYNFGSGQPMPRPGFAQGNAAFAFLTLVAFLLVALLIVNVRRSTAGLAMGAVRFSENGARTLGISVIQTKVLVSGLATFVAALGGGFIAMTNGSTLPDSFAPFGGLVWLAVLVTMGSRSIVAALIAGVVSFVIPGLFSSYIPTSLGDVPTILFGLGAIGLATHPEGAIAQTANNLAGLFGSRRRSEALPAAEVLPPDLADETTSPATGAEARFTAGRKA